MVFKYIILAERQPVLFSVTLQHSSFSYLGEIVSAGFVDISDGFRTFGRSDSLGLEPNPLDSRYIHAAAAAGKLTNY